MSIIGEALLSATINALFDKLTSTDLLQFARQEQVHADLKTWEKILRQTNKVLDDAEERQITDRFVKDWLHELRDLAYDVEDILDEFATESLRRNLLDESQASTSKLRKFIPACCSSLSPQSIKSNVKMGFELKEINDRFEKIIEQKNNLDLKDNLGSNSYKVRYRRIPSTSLHDTHVCGRESDKEAILDMLLKDEGGNVGVPVISITGMGGMGKTTLAQLVYNDVKVKSHFDIKAWACVSEDFDIARVTKAVLQSIAPETSDMKDLNRLQVELRDRLAEKKILIVLDDVWHENYEEWTILCRPFEACSAGSKIVITTRNNSVASMVDTHSTYRLKELSHDDCLSIFTYHSKMDFSEHRDLKEIGEKIVKRCKGLPLAVKTLCGLLRGKVHSKDWEDVLNCKIWTLPEEKSGIIPALRVSYYYLPPRLKRCFAYCSIFPKDYIFEMNEMILLWMAEGFLQIGRSEKEAEDRGKDFFEELYSRSFFQQCSSDSSKFVMHDLINDLAQWAAEDFCFRIEYPFEGEKQLKVPKNVHHLSYINGTSNYECMEKFEALNEMKSIRTLLVLMPYYSACDFLNMLPQLPHLRVLSLKTYSITELPNTIGDLKHLRYLDLSYTKIENLPDSINKLYNLETLILRGCYCLKELCSNIEKLINLRHLYISDARSLERLPSKIGQLDHLRTLSVYIVCNDDNRRLKELKNLTHLHGKLCISGLENVDDAEEAKEADCIGKKNLRELELKWKFGYARNNDIEAQVLAKLKPYQKIEKLTVTGYGGTKFPSWLGNTSFSSLVLLTFECCRNCTSLPSLGQLPLLKRLFIIGLDGIKSIGQEFYGNGCSTPFQSLKSLYIWDMHEWKDWIHRGKDSVIFPRLQRLSIGNCPNLIGNVPEHLPSLESLCIRRCEQLRMFLPSLPGHCKIEITECKEVSWSTRDWNSLNSEVLSNISGRMLLAEKFLHSSSTVVRAVTVDYGGPMCFWQVGAESLKEIIECLSQEFDKIMSFMSEEREEQEQGLACRLQYLALWDCDCLMKLPQVLHGLSFLRGLVIQDCPELTSIPDSVLPSELKFIDIKACHALESLPKSWMQSSNTSLERLHIENCDSLTYIATVQLPPNLKMLEIENCCGLQTLVDKEEVPISHQENVKGGSRMNNVSLNYSNIVSCQAIGNLPGALKCLFICDCPKLESIAESFRSNISLETIHIFYCKSLESLPNDLHNLSHLREFIVVGCQSLVSYPEWQLSSGILKELCIDDCEKLDTLPSGMNNLTSLQRLSIHSCPSIVSFPEDGFPTNLTSLTIKDVKICKSLFEWGLQRLTSLKQLYITGGCPDVMSFPQEEIGMMLPTYLTTLHIYEFPNLECLSSNFQNLISLKELCLRSCPKLKFFPEEGLPPSLLRLKIYECPLLQRTCENDRGLYWPVIALIPSVTINGEDVTFLTDEDY